MYKDVWKRFGLKALIVICAVLLLGGVAIAAPRLRAAPSELDLDSIPIPEQTDEYKVDEKKLNDLRQAIANNEQIPSGGIGQEQWPDTITIDGNTYVEGTHYNVSNKSSFHISQAGQKATFTIEVVTGSGLKASGPKPVEFRITKNTTAETRNMSGDLNASDYVAAAGKQPDVKNAWVVRTLPDTFNADKWDMYITDNTLGKIPLISGIDYDVTNIPSAAKIGADYSASVELNNYQNPLVISASVFQHMSSSNIKITPDETVTPKTVSVEYTENGTSRTLKKNEHYYLKSDESSYEVEGRTEAYFVGKVNGTFTPDPPNFYPMFTDYIIDYDNAKKSIKNPPPTQVTNNSDGRPLSEGTDYEIKDYYFKNANQERVRDKVAGLVYMEFVGKNTYKGTVEKFYTLTRSLSSERGYANADLNVELTALPNEEDKFNKVDGRWQTEYDGKPHAMVPQLSFTNADGKEIPLEEGTDYDVTYTLNNRVITNYNEIIDAGTVYLTIEGKGFYTGKIVGSNTNPEFSYEILPQDVTKNNELTLIPSTFELTEDIKTKIIDAAYLQAKPYNNGPRTKVTDISTGKKVFSYDQNGNNLIADSEWGSLQPGTNYYLLVEFTGNYKGTLPVAFQVQEYTEDYIDVEFDPCDECGSTTVGDHIYTGEAHKHYITHVWYQANGTGQKTEIPGSVYQNKVKWENNINAGTFTIEIPVSNKVSKKVDITIKPRELTDGIIELTGNEGFYEENGILKREYTGYTNLPNITTLTLNANDGKIMSLATEDCYTDGLFVYDEAAKRGTGSAVKAKDIVADEKTKYCFEVKSRSNNFTSAGRAWTVPFVFTPRDIRLKGENGISVAVTPKTSIDTESGYMAHIQNTNNLIIMDNKLREQVRTQDYEIVANSIKTNRMHVDSVITFSIRGKGCYTNVREDVELYVGKNITLTMLKEKRNNDISIIPDPAEIPGVESTTGTVELVEPYQNLDSVPWYEQNDELESSVSLRDHNESPIKALLKGESGTADDGNYSVQVLSTTPQPDDPNDTVGIRYAKVLLVGKNGYYGKITVKVPIEKVDFDDGQYEIRFRNTTYVADDNVYKGRDVGVEPLYDVVKKSAPADRTQWKSDDVLIKDRDYVVPSNGWSQNKVANEGKTGEGNLASLKINGINGFEGELTQTFTIYKRNIGVIKKISFPGSTEEVERPVLNADEGFRLEGWINTSHSYDYTPSTLKDDGREENGVRPQLKLYYNDELLEIGKDYTIGYENEDDRACYSDRGMTYDQLPKVKFSTEISNLNSNFKGSFEDIYEIAPIVLTNKDQCEILLEYYETAFTGLQMKPKVTVRLYRNGDKEKPVDILYDPSKPDEVKDFEVSYENAIFATMGGSKGGRPTNPFHTYVNVKAKDGDKGNFQGSEQESFLIYGEFAPEGKGGRENSAMVVSPQSISYSPNATAENLKAACVVTHYQKQNGQGEDAYDDPTQVNGRRRTLEPIEYVVTGVSNRIGKDLNARVEKAVDYLRGGKDFKMTIVGDLQASYIDYTLKPIGYSGAETVALQDFLTVTYETSNGGRQALSYGTDYEFETAPTANLGKNEVNIIPIEGKSDDYLINKRLITYYVTTELDSLILENVQTSYPYAHGTPVIKPEDIIVKLGGQTLKYGQDYNIEIIGDATSVGTHTIVVTSANEEKFSGKKEQSFTITQYNLENAVKDKLITVNYVNDEKEPYYTGSTVLPRVTSVTIKTPSGSLYTLSDGTGETSAEYEVIAGTQGDHVNWTSGDVKPNFILSGRGNYTGEISYEYSIKRKDISDTSEVTVEAIEDIYYNNGRDITPVPSIKYRGRDLSGIRHSGNAGDYVDWKDYSQHFTYQYSTKIDLKSTGTKEITIRGIGNFIGETTVSYKVIPLNIKDTELVFTGETPVYDSKPQTPAFQLVYAGDVIMQWTGTRAISDFIRSTPEVVFGNNTNATGDEPATVRISITDENDNYQGAKEATFTILPASLDSHTKFLYRPVGGNANEDLKNYKLNLDFIGVGSTVKPTYAQSGEEELGEGQLGIYYDFSQKANHGAFLLADQDYTIEYKYVEPDTDDVDVREDYQDPDISFAGKVKVTITGIGNYADTASFWYYIGKDISADATISMDPTTAVYNSHVQAPKVTVSGVEGLKYIIAKYKDEVAVENLIEDRDFVNVGDYFIRIEGDPRNGTYATKPYTLTYTITPRAFSNNLVIDGFKREYSYTGYEIRPVGISVTDYIDNVKYKLTEDVDYTLTYTNNLNAGTAYINVEGKRNFSGKATANFMITSSTISSGGWNGSNSFLDQGTGEISGATAVSPGNVNMSMDTIDAMYYTGSPVYPKVSIAGMTENVDYTVTFSNNVEVGTAVATIKGIGNNNGTIVKNFRIIAQLSKCTISPIPAQQYTGSEVKPSLTVRCGNSILMEGTDYTVTYSNNINIGTATATIRALNNANYTGSASVRFSIGNDVGGFIISGYAPSYAYTGNAITPGVVVETGSRTLTPGTDYTVSYSNNVNAGTATITVTGIGRYSGTQTANFVIEPKSMQSLSTTDIADRTYTGDAYTPDITVSDGGKVLTKGVDYTVTYTNNTNPGTASILIQGTSNNYSGTKVVSFKISAVAVKGLKASNVKYNSLKLRWTKQGYADGYQLCDSKSKAIKTVKTNSATITGLTAGKTYTYKVRSYIRNADGTRSYGAFSSVLSATTKLRTPTVKVVSNAKGQARISWSKVSGATGYEIYYKKTAGAKYKKLKTVNNANVRVCTVRGMKSGDRAYFRVRAFRKNGSKKVYSSLNPLKVITVK